MSSSGTLGRHIDLPAPAIICLRCLIGALALACIIYFQKKSLRQVWQAPTGRMLLGGVLLGLHWVTYFYSLKLTNVAIGMLALFTYPIIAALLEPFMLKVSFQKNKILLSILTFIGVTFLVPEFSLENQYTFGILVGVFSALCYSLRNILMKPLSSRHSGMDLMLHQLVTIGVLLTPALFLYPVGWGEGTMDWTSILLLSLITTAFGHSLFVASFRYFTITTVSILSSLTPLFGISLGFIFLGEVPKGQTLIGGAIILATVVVEALLSYRQQPSS